jgi:ubiquinone/menaquinone biosynthesis C-methylase UbiE
MVSAVKDRKIEKILEVGCGAGQELLPFVEKTAAFCVGIDMAEELGTVGKDFFQKANYENRVGLVRSFGESLPFADESFDVVLCRLALPYMDNRKTIAEIARVLRPNGIFFLKTHAPAFYFGMIWRRLQTFSLKQFAYPLICLVGGTWHLLTKNQLKDGFWKGKEVFQTRRFLDKEFAKNGLRITGELSDTNIQTPSFVVVKN